MKKPKRFYLQCAIGRDAFHVVLDDDSLNARERAFCLQAMMRVTKNVPGKCLLRWFDPTRLSGIRRVAWDDHEAKPATQLERVFGGKPSGGDFTPRAFVGLWASTIVDEMKRIRSRLGRPLTRASDRREFLRHVDAKGLPRTIDEWRRQREGWAAEFDRKHGNEIAEAKTRLSRWLAQEETPSEGANNGTQSTESDPPNEPPPYKPDGWTRAELVKHVEDSDGRLSPTVFDRIRKVAKVKARAQGGSGAHERFSKAELRKLISACRGGRFRYKDGIVKAWEELLKSQEIESPVVSQITT